MKAIIIIIVFENLALNKFLLIYLFNNLLKKNKVKINSIKLIYSGKIGFLDFSWKVLEILENDQYIVQSLKNSLPIISYFILIRWFF